MSVALAPPTHVRLAKAVHLASLSILALVTAAELGSVVVAEGTFVGPDPTFAILTILVLAGYTTLGRLIVTRADNRIGWLFLAMGFIESIGLPAEGYVQASFGTPYEASLPGTAWAGWVAGMAPAIVAMLLPLFFLLYPTGSPPSPRWRWVTRLWTIGVGLSLVWLAFGSRTFGEIDRYSIPNPLGIDVLEPAQPIFVWGGTGLLLASAGAGVASLVVRFRRARGEERQQILWLMLVGLAAVGILLLMPVVGDDPLWEPLVLVVLVGIPAATAFAIFRYRLYDTGVVVSKTLVLAALGLLIVGVYLGLVLGLGSLIGDRDDPTVRLVATVLVAIGFHPARVRLQRFANRVVYGERATPYEVMSAFGSRIAAVPTAAEVLPEMAEAAARGVGAVAGRVRLLLSGGRERVETWPDGHGELEPSLELPILHAGERIGTLGVAIPAGQTLRPGERALLEDLAAHAGLALSNVRLAADLEAKAEELEAQTEELGRSRERLVTARDAQRRRLERELREGVGATIAAIRDRLGADAVRLREDPDGVVRSLTELGERTGATLEELRDVARGIFPPLLVDRGIGAALDAHFRKLGMSVALNVEPAVADHRFDPAVENAVYFCLVQALQNVRRHAPGSEVRVRLGASDDALRFEVADDGPGFDAASTVPGEGTQIMRDRITALGGDLEIASSPGSGTTVRGTVRARAREEVSA